MACAGVATAKTKAATAINLIIVFSHVLEKSNRTFSRPANFDLGQARVCRN
jgi:hypothetical protein